MYSEIKTRKGKANLYKTDKNTYAVNLPVDVSREIFTKPRKRIRLHLTADSRENTFKALQHVGKIQELLDAQDWKALIEYEKSLIPKMVKKTKVTLQSLWKDYVKAKQEGWEISYIEGEIKEVTRILENITAIYPEDNLDDVINYLLEITTIRQTKRYLSQLSACLRWGTKRRLVQSNPLPDFISTLSTKRRNDEDTDINPFTITERNSIVDAFREGRFERYLGSHTCYADYIEFLFFTGARTSEALGLRWGHIDFEKKLICFQEAKVLAASGKKGVQKKGLKTQKRRLVPMSDRVYQLLLKRKDSSELDCNVFEDINHNLFRRSVYKYVLSRLNIPYRKPYQTRHTFITVMANHSDLKLHQVAKICGTSTKVIEEHYLATNVDISRLPDV